MKFLSIILALFLIIGCQEKKNNNPDKRLQEKEVPDNFDIGKAKDGVFKNEYFGLTFKYNPNWDVLSYDELESMMETNSKAVAKNNKKLKQLAEASNIKTAHHFAAYKYDHQTYPGFNPSVIVMSENIEKVNLKYGDEYLEHVRDLWAQTDMNIKQVGVIKEKKIAGKQFFTMRASITTFGVEVFQDYNCAIIKDFAFIVVETYMEPSELGELNLIKESIQIKKS